MGSSRGQRLAETALVVFATVYAAVAIHDAPAWTVDDAYIVARYGENLVRYHAFVWNPGEPPIEGFTSILGTLVAAGAILLHLSPIKVATLLGEAAFLASGPLILALGRALRAVPPAAGLVAFAHLTMAEHVTHATGGLETEVFVALGLVLALVTARALHGGAADLVAAVAILLALTRPEGVVAGGAAVLVVNQRRAWLLFAGGIAGLVAWRWLTFGELVPNTYFAKHGGWNAAHLHDLWGLVNDHYVDLAAVSIALSLITGRPVLARADWKMAFLAVAVLGGQILGYGRSLPIMDYARRFAVHDVAWLDLLLLLVVGRACRARRLGPVFAAALVGLLLRRGSVARFEEKATRGYALRMSTLLPPAVAWVDTHAARDATVAVYPDAGMLPYLTRRTTIDFGLLNDRTLARAHTPPEVAAYFFARAPDVLLLGVRFDGRFEDEGAYAILADPRFPSHYRLAYQNLCYTVYERIP